MGLKRGDASLQNGPPPLPPKDPDQWAAAYGAPALAVAGRCTAADCPRADLEHVHPRHAPHLFARIDPDTGVWLGRATETVPS